MVTAFVRQRLPLVTFHVRQRLHAVTFSVRQRDRALANSLAKVSCPTASCVTRGFHGGDGGRWDHGGAVATVATGELVESSDMTPAMGK